MQYIFNIYTYIQVHASLATDITLSFSHFYFTHFVCTVSPLYRTFWTMICCLSPLGQVRSGVNVVAKISEYFRRGNELQGTLTVLRHHEWYSSPMSYPLLYSVSLIFRLNLLYSGREYTDRDWVRLKMRNYALQIFLPTLLRFSLFTNTFLSPPPSPAYVAMTMQFLLFLCFALSIEAHYCGILIEFACGPPSFCV